MISMMMFSLGREKFYSKMVDFGFYVLFVALLFCFLAAMSCFVLIDEQFF